MFLPDAWGRGYAAEACTAAPGLLRRASRRAGGAVNAAGRA
ncbi:hypothetical protein [Streptomyces mirabilis]